MPDYTEKVTAVDTGERREELLEGLLAELTAQRVLRRQAAEDVARTDEEDVGH